MKHNNIDVNTTYAKTSIGKIAYFKKEVQGTIPIIFLHGVYYDHNLWNYQVSRIDEQTTISVDMPLHGQSKSITKSDWNMDDCATMLIEILDFLEIEKCYAIGHSWGSMTILRAASQHPERFVGVGLCNMPLEKGNIGTKLQFGFLNAVVPFRKFYAKQAAKAMFSEKSIKQQPESVEYLEFSMRQLSNKGIRKTHKSVISNVDSGYPFLEQFATPAFAIKGKEDYVPTLEKIETIIVEGKHTCPLEQSEKVLELVIKLTEEK